MVSIFGIKEVVCIEFGLSHEELMAPLRCRRVSWPRQAAISLARDHTDMSYRQLARHFGLTNHTSAIFARKAVEDHEKIDREFARALRRCRAALGYRQQAA